MSSSTLLLMSWTPSLQDDTKGYRKGHEGSTKKNGVQHDYNEHLAHQGSYLQGLDYGNPQCKFRGYIGSRDGRDSSSPQSGYLVCSCTKDKENCGKFMALDQRQIQARYYVSSVTYLNDENMKKHIRTLEVFSNKYAYFAYIGSNILHASKDFDMFWTKWEGKENKRVDFYCTDFKLEFLIFQNDATWDGSILSYEVYRGHLRMDGRTMANLEMVTDSEDGGTTGKLLPASLCWRLSLKSMRSILHQHSQLRIPKPQAQHHGPINAAKTIATTCADKDPTKKRVAEDDIGSESSNAKKKVVAVKIEKDT
ncbi:hypothetical protein Tco_0190810 [Tanacetum coccineum]